MKKVLEAIRAIKTDKQQRKTFPTHATRRELLDAGCTMQEIRESVKAVIVRFGQTLNDYYFVENLQE